MDYSAMILGITGQDGILLAQLLVKKGYHLVGFGHQESIQRNQHLMKICSKIQFSYGSMSDADSLKRTIQENNVSEIYNLAAQSSPGLSWRLSLESGEVNAIGAHRLFEFVRKIRPETRIYQASSSEMFGEVLRSPQNEETPLNPVNPYAVTKAYAHRMARIYRETFDSYISCGILFNHESRYRGMNYVSQKVTYGAACTKLGIKISPHMNEQGEPIVRDGKLSLGNLAVTRDWGFAGDYVNAMWLMLQQPKSDDYVIGTGVKRTVQDMCQTAYEIVGADWRDYVISDPRFMRPIETGATVADASKAEAKLGWRATTAFKDMLADMVEAHLERLRQ